MTKSTAIGSNDDPQVALKQVTAERSGTERWNIAWAVKNLGRDSLRIQSARLPHGRFKSEECRFEPEMDLRGGEGAEFQTLVRCGGPAGRVTENAFVILYVTWLDESWRIFVRLRVDVNSAGRPETATELITTQKVGFSG